LNDCWQLGDARIRRIEEWRGEFLPPEEMFTGFDAAAFRRHLAEFAPDFHNVVSNRYFGFLQSWLVEVAGLRILFDTGAGNGKHRPGIPLFGQLDTPFLARLADAGAAPEDIDVVVCSHLHVDHVGWNTRLDHGRWRPTFPRARYLFSAIDRQVWDPAIAAPQPSEVGAAVNMGVFEDSVAPLLEAGCTELLEGEYRIAPGIHLRPAPGHTPGHLLMHVESAGAHALFIGDIVHHPVQIHYPHWNSIFCEDPERARSTRHEVLLRAAALQALVFPAHFGGQHCFRVRDDGDQLIPDLAPDHRRI
jgi:glyoxylase-like metal-dependent hydrolase (beta-lactamase superfamily II)